MSNSGEKLPVEKRERSPAEAALLMRLKVFLTMRWFFIVGIIVAATVARSFNIGFPTLPVYIICALMLLYNLVLMYQVRGLEALGSGLIMQRITALGITHIVLDLLAFTVILHFTGGIENPFIFLAALHIVGGSTLLRRREVFLIATQAILMVTLLVILEYTGIVPHVNLKGFADPALYLGESYIVAVLIALASILYATAYMATAITAELRKRQKEVVNLREQLLDETTGELQRISTEKSELEEERNRFLRFIGIAAHDMKAPLAAIQSYFGVMLGGFSGELTDKQKSMIERSSIRITELMNLISDLLDIPRIESGQLVHEMKEVSIRQVIRHSVSELRGLAKEKGLKLKTEFSEHLPRVYGSAPRLQQVVTNLVNNAIHYTSEGGITVRTTEKKSNIQVDVIDTGQGIPPEDMPKVFDDFFRASNVDAKGTGLGLSITRRIVESHGGKIWVECPCSETGTGSMFSFTLPKKK
ncbi:MAG: HAMP domain-containing histidine kinase [Chloroflexi bacterium]|nr:HAMP domain-containing histidine kinase [Chloroflexota bacterium]